MDDLITAKFSVEIVEEVLKWMAPTDLSHMARTRRFYQEVVANHRRLQFQFHDAVRRILRPRECYVLQGLLDRTGSFIWGLTAYEFFMREDVDWASIGMSAGAPPIDVDIFLNYTYMSRFLHWIEFLVIPIQFEFDGTYQPETCPTLDKAMKWLDRRVRDNAAGNRPCVVGALRFERRVSAKSEKKGGLRLVITRRSPMEAVLSARSSESFFQFRRHTFAQPMI